MDDKNSTNLDEVEDLRKKANSEEVPKRYVKFISKMATEGNNFCACKPNEPLYIPMCTKPSVDLKVESKPLLVFDIDGTLYDQSYSFEKIWKETLESSFSKQNKTFFLEQFAEYSRIHSVGVKGYFLDKTMTLSDYKEFIDMVPFSILKENNDLKVYLQNLKMEKWCFTNSCETHSARILQNLGIESLFKVIVHCDYAKFIPTHKPMENAYSFVEELSGTRDIIFFDDVHDNVETALKRGWIAYHVDDKTHIIDIIAKALSEWEKL